MSYCSRILAFEVDRALCAQLNARAPRGLTYHPVALGKTEEERDFYETQHPMCSSLYRPNEALMDLFQALRVAKLKKVSRLRTVSLDHFMKRASVGEVDFIKIDIQGAELEVFQGGTAALEGVVAIITEVEFVPLYVDQPLFGDVSAFLTGRGLAFHKFLGVAGRALKPIFLNNDPNYAVQHMWSDAMFIRDLLAVDGLDNARTLKLAVLAELYGSPDVAHHLLAAFDRRNGGELSKQYLQLLKGGGPAAGAVTPP